MSTSFLMVTTTVASLDEARTLARSLVDARLAACVQILPIESVYRWGGAVETAAEHLLLCKIRAEDFSEVEAAIRARHGYEVPEIVAVPVVAGSTGYFTWLTNSTER